MIWYGFHFSLKKGISGVPDLIKEMSCTTGQIFSGNPRAWHQKELDENEATFFKEKRTNYKIGPMLIHMPYLPNLATPDPKMYEKSVNILVQELKKCEKLSIEYLNTHIGKSMGDNIENALKRVISAIKTAIKKTENSKTIILLENTAGQGSEIGYKFEHLKKIIDAIDEKNRIGVCLDTAHLFEAGYDLRDEKKINETFNMFDKIIGYKYLMAIHYNDSLTEFNSHKDRHQHIGKGYIGDKGMKAIINFPPLQNLPFIMETPVNNEGNDEMNLKTILKYLGKI